MIDERFFDKMFAIQKAFLKINIPQRAREIEKNIRSFGLISHKRLSGYHPHMENRHILFRNKYFIR